ncbi:MAG: hypothetical protein AAB592_04145 [Patescibacteria group bacterium]
MEFTLTKYEKPIVWLDTNFIITMARKSDLRTGRLLDFLRKKVGEYFLVQGDNTELKLGNGNIKDYTRILDTLSCGVSFLPYETIEQFQFQAVARAVIDKQNSTALRAGDYFHSDPIAEEERSRKTGFVVGVHFNIPLLNQLDEGEKKRIFDRLLANRPHRSIDEQQKLEAETPAKIFRLFLIAMQEKVLKGQKPTLEDIYGDNTGEKDGYFASNFRFVSNRMEWWRTVGGARDMALALKETYDFLESAPFKTMPFNKLNNTLWGDIYAGGETLKPSDYWDVKHISSILPFCNIVFTENRMRLRLNKYRLGEEYKTEVYSMQNIEEFFRLHC